MGSSQWTSFSKTLDMQSGPCLERICRDLFPGVQSSWHIASSVDENLCQTGINLEKNHGNRLWSGSIVGHSSAPEWWNARISVVWSQWQTCHRIQSDPRSSTDCHSSDAESSHLSRLSYVVVRDEMRCDDQLFHLLDQAMKLIARSYACKIIARDGNRGHHFHPNGQCSCSDHFWFLFVRWFRICCFVVIIEIISGAIISNHRWDVVFHWTTVKNRGVLVAVLAVDDRLLFPFRS